MTADVALPTPRRRPTKAKAAPVEAPARTPLTPETWIDAATDVLVSHGIDSVRVDLLAKRLQVTRGSFYWHFKDRNDLLTQVLQTWRRKSTEELTRRLETAHTDPAEQVRDVLSLPFRGRSAVRAAQIELALRDWARRDPVARQVMDESDASRLAYISQIFSSLGFGVLEARSRAFLLYSHVVAASQMTGAEAALPRDERNRFVEQLIQTPLR